jgi:hypothetical protein
MVTHRPGHLVSPNKSESYAVTMGCCPFTTKMLNTRSIVNNKVFFMINKLVYMDNNKKR